MDRPEPVLVRKEYTGEPLVGAVAVAAGANHSCAIVESEEAGVSEIYCWGSNNTCQVLFSTDTPYADGAVQRDLTWSDARAITLGDSFTCVTRTSGALNCWGFNADSQLGRRGNWCTSEIGTIELGGLQASAGGGHACALRSSVSVDGRVDVYCWGRNTDGQCGLSGTSRMSVASPVRVDLSHSAIALSASLGAPASTFTCAVLDNNNVSCWGANNYAQLGREYDSASPNNQGPQRIDGLEEITAVAAGGVQACAIDSSGHVLCWGGNLYGERGDDTLRNRRHTPRQVDGISDLTVTAITAGLEHTCILGRVDGSGVEEVRCWETT